MRIIKPGQRVTLAEGDLIEGVRPIEGTVSSVTIYDANVAMYTVRWFAGGELLAQEFCEYELSGLDDLERLNVGAA